ncbi:YwbE family protein [Candidatus Fermentibacteria bacterium]|nr:YwbE family protein [Candidatus Fermentibacteria bacterium]
MNGNNRSDIAPGMRVKVVRKEDQRSGALTEGVVRNLLTKSAFHPHGIKVRLESGTVGRVKVIVGAQGGASPAPCTPAPRSEEPSYE